MGHLITKEGQEQSWPREEGFAAYQLVGGVTAYQDDDG